MPGMQIEQIIGQVALKKIDELIRGYEFKPYYFIRQLKHSDIAKLFESQLMKIVSDNSNFVLLAKKGNDCAGFLIIEKQHWDSSFFGFDCYKVEHIFACAQTQEERRNIKKGLLDFVSDFCIERKIRYLNIKVDTQDNSSIYALERCGFSLISNMLQLAYMTQKKRKHFKIIGKIRPYQTGDLDILRKIARDSMRFDHFHSDLHFTKESSDNVYVSLVENCCKGIIADKVFVVEKFGQIVGYVACVIKPQINENFPIRIGYIRHLVVSRPEGFGCGAGLQEAALNWFQDKVDMVESATTIQNLSIIRISVKSSMDIVASYLRFSKWFGA